MFARLRYAVLIVCVAALLPAATTHAALTANAVEKALQNSMTEKYKSKNLKVEVTPYSDSARARKGQFARLLVKADSAERKGKGIKIVDLYVLLKHIQLDVSSFLRERDVEVKSYSDSDFHIRILPDDVNDLLARKDTPIQNLQVEFGNGNVTFTGKYIVPIKLTGRVTIQKDYELHFKPESAHLGILGLPIGIVNRFLAKLNPIVDMREVPLKPKLKKIKITPKYLWASG